MRSCRPWLCARTACSHVLRVTRCELQALFLLGGSAAGFSLAAIGLCLLFSVFTLRMLAPTADQYSAELYFDFTKPLALATAHLQCGVTLVPDHQVCTTNPTVHPGLSARRWLCCSYRDEELQTRGKQGQQLHP